MSGATGTEEGAFRRWWLVGTAFALLVAMARNLTGLPSNASSQDSYQHPAWAQAALN